MNRETIRADLPTIHLLFEEPLSNYTFTKTGGPADVLLFPKNKKEVKLIVDYCLANNQPWLVLGNASNLIVRDNGITGFVLMLTAMNTIRVAEKKVIVDGGAKLIDTTKVALGHELTGLEFACGIPGSVGGAIYMNAGAYGGEVVDVFESVEVILEDGTFKTLTKADMDFSYRYSILQQQKTIVLRVTFLLEYGEKELIGQRMKELTDLREAKQPLEYPSCGSVFKRPPGHFTGKLIQDAGLQGLIWGGAQVSEKHAGFIVNINKATATDYVELIAHIQKTIWQTDQVKLETEVRIIGRED